MIQRIQSLYLLLAVAVMVLCLCFPVGRFVNDGNVVAQLYNLSLQAADGTKDFKPWALFCLLLVPSVLAFVAIFLFKKRMLQVRLCVFNMILLVGYCAVYAWFAYKFGGELSASFSPSIFAAAPVVSLILHYLAFRGILADELLVRSLDRIR